MYTRIAQQLVTYVSRQYNLATAKVAPIEALTGEHILFVRIALIFAALIAFMLSEALGGNLHRYDDWIFRYGDEDAGYARFHG